MHPRPRSQFATGGAVPQRHDLAVFDWERLLLRRAVIKVASTRMISLELQLGKW
jgi:hypothetical protein